MFSILEQHNDGSWWYHPGDTYGTRDEAETRGQERYGSGKSLTPRPYTVIEHKKPFPQDMARCSFDCVHFNFAGGYHFSLGDENKTNTTGLYFLQAGSAKSAWKKWQVETFRLAQKHDRCIFSKQGILDLYAELVEYARNFRNYQEGDIRQPDFEFAEKFGMNVGLIIGPDCYLSFIPVAGYYNSTEIRRVDLEAWHNHFDEKRGGAK